MMDPVFPSDVRVVRPSDVDTLGRMVTNAAYRDADAMRVLAQRLPAQIRDILTQRGIDASATADVYAQADKVLHAITGYYEGLAMQGDALTRVADTIVYLLKARQSKAVEVNGYSITGT